MSEIIKYNVPYDYKYKLCTVNTKLQLVLSKEDWMNCKHVKWYELLRDFGDLHKGDIVNSNLIKMEDYIDLKGSRKKDIPLTEFRREYFE